MGGPSSLPAPQVASEQASLGVGLDGWVAPASAYAATEEISEKELSTASLDGARMTEKQGDLGSGSASEAKGKAADQAPLLQKNEAALKKAAAEVGTKAPAPKKAVSSSRYFIQPASGHNWGELHGHNGVDIANSCGTSVVAAAAGRVVSDPGLGSGASGYNSGYGRFVMIRHDNGTKTRYAHLSKVSVSVGQAVEQGEMIGRIGNTGKVRGATGCHLHFEVIGGRNPFARS